MKHWPFKVVSGVGEKPMIEVCVSNVSVVSTSLTYRWVLFKVSVCECGAGMCARSYKFANTQLSAHSHRTLHEPSKTNRHGCRNEGESGSVEPSLKAGNGAQGKVGTTSTKKPALVTAPHLHTHAKCCFDVLADLCRTS